ncbi:MAG: hypothetical protein ABIR39_22140 [Nocardioides sp.]|uniref:hypothetical protein n=1 Tax=Nocardioides sp. TaxID=35761 RepID=UPI003266D08E
MSLYVYVAALKTSAQSWEDTGETIRGSRKSLSDIDASLLGPRVATAAQGFIDTWLTEIKSLQTAATDHGDALREAALLVHQADADSIARSQELLAWTDRNVSPTGGL